MTTKVIGIETFRLVRFKKIKFSALLGYHLCYKRSRILFDLLLTTKCMKDTVEIVNINKTFGM